MSSGRLAIVRAGFSNRSPAALCTKRAARCAKEMRFKIGNKDFIPQPPTIVSWKEVLGQSFNQLVWWFRNSLH
jgi:hypothetical protein